MDVIVQTHGAVKGRVRSIALQLKSTHRPKFVENDAYVTYRLSKRRYNQLIEASDLRRFLVVVALPAPPEAAVSLECDAAHLHGAAWWGVVQGSPTTSDTKQIKIPTNQRFDAHALEAMLLTP
jgi:Domain of unknown function (DUF4365)